MNDEKAKQVSFSSLEKARGHFYGAAGSYKSGFIPFLIFATWSCQPKKWLCLLLMKNDVILEHVLLLTEDG